MNYNERKSMISKMLMGLNRVAHKYGVCIVVINNMKSGKREYSHGGGGGGEGGLD